ncbi:MAG: hypothetical protein KC422_19840 [Trueperaceae bacterium]|nr:hypothetical protein [Trueperaceae bacterium]
MSRLQKLILAFVSESNAKAMEAESRLWFLKCLRCAFEESVWDIGGIRWKAKGNSRNYRKCTNCKKRSWHQMYKKEAEPNL